MEATDVWTIVDRPTGQQLSSVRLFRDVGPETLFAIADYSGPNLTKAVLWNERTGQVVF